MSQYPTCQEANVDISVLTWLTLNHRVSNEPVWAPTHCLVLTDVTEGVKPAWVTIDAWTNAVLFLTGKDIITVVVSDAFWGYVNNGF